MRYEVYGVYSTSGHNYLAGVARTLKQALVTARESVDTNMCPLFAILVKSRANSYPYEIMSGYTRGDTAFTLLRATMLVSPNERGNPITQSSDGAQYWKGYTV